jgi:hypothetical protein
VEGLKISRRGGGTLHCTEIDFALSFGVVIVKMTDLSKNESRDFFGIILDQKKLLKATFVTKKLVAIDRIG